MKIAVIDYYDSGIERKDPGQMTIGLKEVGVDVLMVPLNPVCMQENTTLCAGGYDVERLIRLRQPGPPSARRLIAL